MKHKKISYRELLLSLDRLTRFKPTLEKYPRVFLNIVNKYSGANAKSMSTEEICAMAKEIFNSSMDEKDSSLLSALLKKEEEKNFSQDSESARYLEHIPNVAGLLKYIDENAPLNLKRLKYQDENPDVRPEILREKYELKYPIEKVILCEGATEEILLEELARAVGYDFNKHGIYLLGAGGKNQVARKYYKMRNEVKLPIFILMDYDAQETKKLITPKLRECDKIYIIRKGEFEDILPENLILRALNSHFKNHRLCDVQDFNSSIQMSKNLKEVFRVKGFGDFKKSEFAKLLKMHIRKDELNGEILEIVEQIKNLSLKN